MIAALAGGVGAARLLRGLVQVVDPGSLVAVVNTGDDAVIHGLHISPDIDTVTYTLAGISNAQQGWGLAEETWTVMEELERIGGDTWFRLGDRDLATHLYRTSRLGQGASLSEVTSELARARGLTIRLIPMSDDAVRTTLTLANGEEVSFQDYFVRLRHQVAVSSVHYSGATSAHPAAGVIEALQSAEKIIICPSNPILSIGPILSIDQVHGALAERRSNVWAVSPIVAGHAIKGPADRLLAELGHEPTVAGVARFYAGLVGTLVIDEADAALASEIEACGMRCVVTPTVMHSTQEAAKLAATIVG